MWAIFAAIALLSSTAQANACDKAQCSLENYLDAHIAMDVATVYELTAISERGEKTEFFSSYHESRWAPEVFQEFYSEHTSYTLTPVSEHENFARIKAETQYPDFRTPALERAKENHRLKSIDDWAALVEYMNERGFDMVEDESEFYLIKQDDGQWRVLRPLLHQP